MIDVRQSRFPVIRSHRFRSELCISFFQLNQLLNAGINIERSIADLCQLEVSSATRRVWNDVSERVNAGQALPAAMQHWPSVFDKTTIALMNAAHANGELSAACQSIYEYLQWQADVRSRLQTVLVYPVFSLAVLSAVIVFLLLVVVPSLRGFVLSNADTVAWHTQLLLLVSEWVEQHMKAGLLVMFVSIFVIVALARSVPIVQLLWHTMVLKIPVAGALVVNLSLSRYTRCCADLYGSGVSLDESLQLAEATVSNKVIRADLETVRLSLVQGVRLCDALSLIHSVPVLFKRMLSIGESSGGLEKSLLHLSRQQAKSTEQSLKRAEQLIGPAIMCLAGSSLLWVVVSILGPVYDAAINVVLSA